MRLGIVGTGKIVDEFLTFAASLKHTDLIAICSTKRSIEKAKRIKEEHNFKYYTSNYQRLLQDHTIDTIYIALPNHLHFSYAKDALLSKKHVILEKPITSNYMEAVELANVANKNHCMLLEAITNQYLPIYQEIKERIATLGDIKVVICNMSQYSSRYDAFREGTILPAFDPDKSGGALMDLNVYNIHFMVGLFHEPNQVLYLPNIERGIDTSGILVLDYGDFKCICVASKDTNAPVSNTIQGNEGFLQITSPLSLLLDASVIYRDGTKEVIPTNSKMHRMYYEFTSFENIIDKQDYKKAEAMMEHSLIVAKILQSARNSANLTFQADQKYHHELPLTKVYENNELIGYGGDQDWFEERWARRAGCASVLATNLVSYYKNIKTSNKDEFVKNMEEMFTWMTPGRMGFPYLYKFAHQFVAYFRLQGLSFKPIYQKTSKSYEHALSFVLKSIDEKHPVGLLILHHRAHELKDDNWHWVCISGYIKKESGYDIIFSDCGKRRILDAKILFDVCKFNVFKMVRFQVLDDEK